MGEEEFQYLLLAQLKESPTNPRKRWDQEAQDELTKSVVEHGVLQPIVVRPQGKHYEIVAGSRRYRAAKAAGHDTIPSRVRNLSDDDVLEVQVIENVQREDVHPMDEAEGYHLLLKSGYKIERIAERIGRSIKYIYDRMKLLDLTKHAQTLFAKDRITAGHAILLARLAPADQGRAISDGLFTGEHLLWDPTDKRETDDPQKAVSVRELQAWIDQHVKFDPGKANPMLFPDTVKAVDEATAEKTKIIPITYEYFVRPDARDGNRVWGPKSWKRADGKQGSKTCDRKMLGVFVVGIYRGQSFDVCIDKKRCTIHWGSEQREAKKTAKLRASGKSGERGLEKMRERQAEEDKKREEQRERWKKALPEILKALAAAVKKAPTTANGFLGSFILQEVSGWRKISESTIEKYIPRGRSADDLIRHTAFRALYELAINEYQAPESLPRIAKGLGINVQKILNATAPLETRKTPPKTKKKAKKKAA